MGSYKKKLSIVLLLFLLINFCVCSSANATTTYQNEDMYSVNPVELLQNEQEYLATIFLSNMVTSNTYIQRKTEIDNMFKENYVHFVYYKPTGSSVIRITANFYKQNVDFANLTINGDVIDTTHDLFYDIQTLIPISAYRLDYQTAKFNKSLSLNANNGDMGINNYNDFLLPTFLIFYNNLTVQNFNNGIAPNTNLWSLLLQSIDNNTSATEDTTQAVNNLRNDFNEEESDSDYSYPTDNPTQDITESSIDGVFSLFYMKINAWDDALMRIPIPFTGKYFDIPSNLTQNVLNSFPAGNVIGRLLGLIWYYLLGVYIIKDVQKYIDGLQTGEILTKSDTNIKTEML